MFDSKRLALHAFDAEPLDSRPTSRESETKKPGSLAGFFVVYPHEMRATAYPAECRTSGRRARDVMPAAIRALVRTVAV
jgi:hypothetical protein